MIGLRKSPQKIVWTATVMVAIATHAWAGTSAVPDWVMQAAAAQLPSYPPRADAVVLLDDTLITVTPDGKTAERERMVLKILKPQGRRDAHLEAWYSKDNKLLSFHAWSIAPDGHQYSIKDNEVRDVGYEGGGMLYVDLRAKAVDPPGADPNGVVAYEAVRQISNYGENERLWHFQGGNPERHAVFEIDLPPGWKSYSAWLHHDAVSGTEVAPNHWRWELQDVPAIDLENVSLAPPWQALVGRMVVHYSASELPTGEQRWTEIGNWYDSLAAPRSEAPLEVATKSREVAANATGFKAKIQAVAGFMQREIRYVGIEIGIGGFQPHPAADVFKYRYGDCKDKATLLIAMLNSVGVRATWVMVDTQRGVVDPALPSRDGNHMIAAIEMPVGVDDPALRAVVKARTGKRYLIFDPTDPYTPIGLIRPDLQASYGVLVAGQDSQVIQLPTLDPDASAMVRTANFSLDSDGTLKGKVAEVRSGHSAWNYRRLVAEDGEKEQREFMEHRLQHDLASFNLDSATFNGNDMSKNVEVDFSLTANSYAKSSGDLLLLRPRVLGRNSEAWNDKPRKYPIDLRQTGTWRENLDIALPEGYIVDDVPEPVSVDVGFASYKSEVKAAPGVLHYSREYTVKDLDLPADKSDDVRKLMAAMTSDEDNNAVLKKK